MVLHRCDNPPCIRPEHLFLGTQADNIEDAVAKGRHSSVGDRNNNAKLTNALVASLRRKAKSGVRAKELAKEFKVGQKYVYTILGGYVWDRPEAYA